MYAPFKILADQLPRNPRPITAPAVCSGVHAVVDRYYLAEFERYHSDPAFGWYVVERLCAAGSRFPIFPEGPIIWLQRAYLWKCFPDRYETHRSILPVRRALGIHIDAGSRPIRAILNAALISKGATIDGVAGALGLPGDVVAAYESLFFSVLSRRDELMFLRNIAYPNSRFVELSEKYLDETSLDVLLLRIGYNGGLENVLYAAGLQDDPTAGMTGAEAAELLNEAILSTGCMLASNGFLNHGKQHPAITATLELIKASKAMLPPGLDGDQEKGGPNMGEVCGKAMQAGSHGAN